MDTYQKRAFHKSAENYMYTNGVLKLKQVIKKNDIGQNQGM